ncbi:NifB/NifX family molybdenum-iron cluster-binding protein [Hippea alviniae]|uniref:NifB/NifX family molybdenum-iron cluster-binding protein n=1 Tax=Hippea alviniae TaxID=1279027 RepID=UPI000401B908|nr:NifB/NifX family molybdenum-iron cluster-binding protein [Hippea alviniae]
MKVAFPTNNLKKIASHTALSKYLAIVDIGNGEIMERVAVKNPIPEMVKDGMGSEETGRGLGAGRIIPAILSDYGVELFVARDIGEGMRMNLEYAGISVLETEEKEIEKIIESLIRG